MALESPTPEVEEVRTQLERMLASKRFRVAPKQAAFFGYVVRRTLAGKPVTENQVGRKVYRPNFNGDKSSDVRVAAISLREKLALYFENEGADDPVIIGLPKPQEETRIYQPAGEAYRPTFSYNPRSEVAKEYRLGCQLSSPKIPTDIVSAMKHFIEVVSLKPLDAMAYIGLAEVNCIAAFTHPPACLYLVAALEASNKAVKLAPGLWKSHAAAGAAWMLSANFEKAHNAFAKALALDKVNTTEYGWFHIFLFVTGHREKALKMQKLRTETESADANIISVYGLLLYCDRQFSKADVAFSSSLERDPNCWLAHLGIALTLYAANNSYEAYLRLGYVDHCTQQGKDKILYPGLAALFYVTSRKPFKRHGLESAIEELSNPHVRTFIQVACAAMSQCDFISVSVHLYCAWRSFEPGILFIDALPLFDPVRTDPRVAEIIQPTSSEA